MAIIQNSVRRRGALGTALFGLVLVAVGAGWTAKSVIVSEQTATQLASTKWGMNAELRDAVLGQSRDAQSGLILVVVGTFLQIAGVVLQERGKPQ
jgi:hypothetical protein